MASNKALKLISIIFHPIFIAIPLIISFSINNLLEIGIAVTLISIIPFCITAYYARKEKISIDIIDRNKRKIPYIVSIASFLLSSLIFYCLNSPLLFTLSIAYFNVSILLFIINTRWKISVHCAAISGLATDATYVFGLLATPLFILVAFIGWVRYKMHVHTLSQIIAGTFISLMISLLTFIIFYKPSVI